MQLEKCGRFFSCQQTKTIHRYQNLTLALRDNIRLGDQELFDFPKYYQMKMAKKYL